MTIDEKRHAIRAHCSGCSDCTDCALFKNEHCHCYENASDSEIEENFLVLFGNVPTDMVNSPKHYALPDGMEVIDVEIATQGAEAVKEHCICAAIEYPLRRKKKNGDEDVRKAHWWLSKYIEMIEKEAD